MRPKKLLTFKKSSDKTLPPKTANYVKNFQRISGTTDEKIAKDWIPVKEKETGEKLEFICTKNIEDEGWFAGEFYKEPQKNKTWGSFF